MKDNKVDWSTKTHWIDSKGTLRINIKCYPYEEQIKQREKIREIMELNMVMYGKW